MRYTVELETVSNSVFIYKLESDKLLGCDMVITTNFDDQIYDGREGDIDLDKAVFEPKFTLFETKPDKNIRSKISNIEDKQRKRGWNCIMLDEKEELEEAAQNHLSEYKRAVEEKPTTNLNISNY